MSFLFRLFFRVYHSLLSPAVHALGAGGCRFQPSCSEYAEVAIARFGPLKGGWLALRRLARCQPFAKGGLDQVPLDESSFPGAKKQKEP